MKGTIIFIGILIFIGFIYYKRKKKMIEQIIIPEHLGCRRRRPLKAEVMAIEKALDSRFEQRIKERYLGRHKKTTEHEFQLLLFELKRFFIMCSLLKNVPMFSDKVDDIWHVMLLFTKEYDEFSHKFCGQFIHHVPVEKRTPQPNERAWFDLIYTQLFKCTSYSPVAWGGFFRNPLDLIQLQEIRSSSILELKKKYFREEANHVLVQTFIQQLKNEIEDSLKKTNFKIPPSYYKDLSTYAPYLAQAMIFNSMNHPKEYKKYMTPAPSTSSHSSCGTGCSGGSSCSNCGSSCGSGCGGGCGSS